MTSRLPLHALLSVTVLGFACIPSQPSDDDSATDDDSTPGVDRGPTQIDLDADPNGLWWDAKSGTLLIADDNGNRILTWTDEAGLGLAGDLPAPPEDGPGLGQVVLTHDGTRVVTRFGFGTAGDVATLDPAGQAGIVPGLDPTRRRIGLTVADDGTLYDGWFIHTDTGKVGGVGRLTLDGTETEVIGGLLKVVGVLAVGDDLYVSDQERGEILVAPLADPAGVTVFAAMDSPDLLAAGPDGSLFTGSKVGNVYQVNAGGEVQVFSAGHQEVRGTAYDPGNRRLFVADHDGYEADGLNHHILILPVGP